eukprot:Gb_30939 [translate_table: standard]
MVNGCLSHGNLVEMYSTAWTAMDILREIRVLSDQRLREELIKLVEDMADLFSCEAHSHGWSEEKSGVSAGREDQSAIATGSSCIWDKFIFLATGRPRDCMEMLLECFRNPGPVVSIYEWHWWRTKVVDYLVHRIVNGDGCGISWEIEVIVEMNRQMPGVEKLDQRDTVNSSSRNSNR